MPSAVATGVEHPPPASVEIGALLVTQIRLEARSVISLRLEAPPGVQLPRWEPGAHIDLELPSGLLRQYSLCGDPADRSAYVIAVLREPQSRGGSNELHDTSLVGRTLVVRAVRNHFSLTDAPSTLLIGGGIGITPLLPMAAQLFRRADPWQLVYLGRDLHDMPFAHTLAQYGDHVTIHASGEGRLDIATLIAGTDPTTAVYCCGPEELMRAAQEACGARSFHMERFNASPGASRRDTAGTVNDATFTVTLQRTKVDLPVPPNRTILEVVRDVVPTVPSSCEEGYCGSCETRVLAGTVDHRDDILDDAERDANDTMFICVSRASSPNLVLDL